MLNAIRNLFASSEKRNLVSVTTGQSTAEPFPWMYGDNSKAGQTINPHTVLTYAPVWQAVKMISGDIAKTPINLFDISGDKKEIDKDHPAFPVVARQPNRDQSAQSFWAQMLVEYLIYNKSYAWISRDSQLNPLELHPIPTHSMYMMDTWAEFNETPDGMPRFVYVTYYPEAYFILMPREVFHVHGLEVTQTTRWKHQFKQPSWWHMARNSIGLALASEEFNSRFFNNNASIGGVLAIPPNYTDKAAKNLEEGFRQRFGSADAAFKTAILRDGAKFIPMQQNAENSQMHELRVDQVREVARWFNLPPSKLGLDDTTSYSSKAEDNRNYFDQTLSPIMASITAECWFKMLTSAERESDSHMFEYDVTKLLQTDRKTMSEVASNELDRGVITFNEFRERIGMNPIEGGDSRLVPLNMSVIDSDGNVTDMTPEPSVDATDDLVQSGGQSDGVPEDNDEDQRQRMVRVFVSSELSAIKSAANRKDGLKFCQWWDSRKRYPLMRNVYIDINNALNRCTLEELQPEVVQIVTTYQNEVEQWTDPTQPLHLSFEPKALPAVP